MDRRDIHIDPGNSVGFEIGVSIAEPPMRPSHIDVTSPDSGRWEPAGRSDSQAEAQRRADQLLGKEFVDALASGIGDQIAAMALKVHERLDHDPEQPPRPGRLGVDSITIKFGIGVKAGMGRALAVFADIGGESSIEVTLTLKRPGSD